MSLIIRFIHTCCGMFPSPEPIRFGVLILRMCQWVMDSCILWQYWIGSVPAFAWDYVISWQISNTLDNIFCIKALEKAFKHSQPEVFNTDQGVQFTSHSFTEHLESAGVKISMDGRGGVFDNIFIERLWRTVKYEDIYLKNYDTVTELEQGLERYFRFYNNERFHQSLDFLFAQAFSKSLITERQFRSIMIVKEQQMDNDPPYFSLFLVLILGVTIIQEFPHRLHKR